MIHPLVIYCPIFSIYFFQECHQHFCRETHYPHLIYTYSKIFSLSRNLIFLQEKNSAFALLLIPVYISCTFKTTYSQNQHHHPNLSLLWLCPRPISNSQLHVLPHFHPCPINLVVFKGVYSFRMGYLILRGASRLDAFSVYPFRAWLPGYRLCSLTGAPAARPSRSSRTKDSSSQISYAHAG